ILESKECDIVGKNSAEVFIMFSNLAAKLTISTLLNFEKIIPKKQDESLVTHCKKIKKENGLITLDNASEIYQKFLAFYPWPGIFFENGMKFLDIELIDSEKTQKSGVILQVEKESFLLSCKKGILRIKTL
ncbi:methionyl-tRNA formyltransferase, partial [Campylobacter lari]